MGGWNGGVQERGATHSGYRWQTVQYRGPTGTSMMATYATTAKFLATSRRVPARMGALGGVAQTHSKVLADIRLP